MKYLSRVALMAISLLVCSIAQATDVVFDVTSTNASAYTSYCGQTCNVTLQNKTFSAYEWDGAVFPFSASTDVLNATFGEGKWDLQEFDSFDGTTIKMKAATSIVADTPYAIRIKQTVENPTFSGVTFASSISTNYIKVTHENNLEFWGTYFKTPWYSIVNGQGNPVTALSFKSDGSGLGNWRPNQETFRARDISSEAYYGVFAWFYHPTLNTTTPSLSYDGISSGSGGGESGGGGDEPAPTTLAGKIAARAQITDAPTIYIDLPGIGNQTLGEYLYKILGNDKKAEEAPYRPAKIQVVATSDTSSPHYLESFTEDAIDANGNTNLEIKVRGNSTALANEDNTKDLKRPYRLKFAKKSNSTDGKAHKHDLLGYGYSKRNWTLLANVNDKSLLRNALTYHIGKAVGMPFCPGYKFVDLVINGDYRGTYQISDHCEVDANRININEDTGWYVEFQGRNTMCDYPMCFSDGINMNINNPEPADDTDPAQCAAIINPMKDWFLNKWKKAFGAGYTNHETGWRAYNDEESLIKFWIATELTGDYDGLMSVKSYREADGKLCWGPLWDKDLAFGNWSDVANPTTDLVVFYNKESSVRDDFQKLTKDPEFMILAKETLDNLISSGIKANLLEKIDEMADVVRETEKLDYEKWGEHPTGAFGYVGGLANYQAYVDQLKKWLSDRIDYVQQRFTSLAAAANTVGEFEYDVTNSELDLSSMMDKKVNVTMKNRSFTANGWNVISLPFNVDETQMKAVFGNNYELKEFTGVSSDGSTMIFQTPADNAIVAGNPYLIKPSQAVSNPVFNNVMLTYAPPGWSNNVYYGGESVTYGNYTFTGHITNAYLYKSVKIVGTDGSLQDYSAQNALNGSMAYITIANGAETPTISFEAEQPVERTQMNDVPTIYIDTDAPIDADNWGTATIEVFDRNNMIGGNFSLDNTGLSVKYVGDGTNMDIKTSYRLKFTDVRALLGSKSGSYKQWVLESNDDDPSMLRNGLTEELGDQLGFSFTPGCQYADLVVNGTYVGTYQITDRIKVESGRILVNKKKTDWLMEIAEDDEVNSTDLYVAGDDSSPNIVIKNPDTDEWSDDQKDELKTAVSNYFTTFWDDIQNKVDQTSFINWYVASEILGGYKQLSDIFVYKDNADVKLFFGPLWSNDKAYGNNAEHPVDMSDLNTAGSYNGMIFTHAKYKVMCNKIEALWQEQWFKDAVIAKWNTIYGDSKTKDLLALLTAKIDVLATEIAQTRVDNYASTANGGAGWTLDGEYSAAVKAIKDYLTERFVYLDTKFKELSANESVETVELIDGQPYTNTADQTVEKVTYTRTFNNTKWQAWFAPFDLVVDDYLNDFSFAKIHQINLVNDGTFTTGDKIEILYTLAETGKIYANMPYLIKAKSEGEKKFELSNVTLKSATDITPATTETTAAKYSITGTYQDVTATSASPFMALAGGTINWYQSSTIKPFRWFIRVTPKGNYAKPQVVIEEYNPDATGIHTTTADDVPESYFSPNGIQLEKPKKGLNIIRMKDGTTRKVMVK